MRHTHHTPFLCLCAFLLSGCIAKEHPPIVTSVQAINASCAFTITGKLGIRTLEGASSAFYTWSQTEDGRFGIDITGAFGIGAVHLDFDGQSARITAQGNELQGTDPDALIYQATGLHLPITAGRYWVLGRPSPSDTNALYQNGRLIQTHHQTPDTLYQVTLQYDGANVSQLTIVDNAMRRLVITINHVRAQ